MANRYWVGGSGTWNATSTTNWSTSSGGASGASAPGTADAAIFDANSNTGTNDFTVTLSGSPACLTLNTTGIDPATAMTVAGTGSLEVRGTVFTLTNKVAWNATGNVSFTLGAATVNITTAGVTINSPFLFSGSSNISIFNFVDAFTSTKLLQFDRGSITTTGSNKNITVLRFVVSGAAGTRTINTGTGTFAITGNNATVLDASDGIFTSPSALNLTYSGSTGTRTVTSGSSSASKVSINVTAGSDTFTFLAGGSISIKSLDFTGFSGTLANQVVEIQGNLTFSTGMTLSSGTNAITITNSSSSITTNSKTLDFPVNFGGTGTTTITLNDNLTIGSTRTLNFAATTTTVQLGNYDLSTGLITSTGSTNRTITSSSGKVIITGNNAQVLNTGAGFVFTGVIFELSYSGSTGTRLIAVNSGYPQLKVSTGSDTITINQNSLFDGIDFTGFSGTFSLSGSTIDCSNNVIFSSTMTTGSTAQDFRFVTNNNSITTNGITINFNVVISSGTLNFIDNFTCSRVLQLSGGTLNSNNKNFNLTTFNMAGSTTRTANLGSGTWTITGSSTNAWIASTVTNATITGTAIITLTSSSAKTFAGGGGIWPTLNQGGSGALTITGSNTFDTLSNSVYPATVTFTSGTTTTVTNFNLGGIGGSLVTLNASTAGTRATLSKSSGSVSAQYLNIIDSNATGGASWTALNSTNGGNNLGWVFAVPGFFFFFGV